MTATPPETADGRSRAPRWMWIVLVLSLALNLLIVGIAAAAMMHFRNGHGGERARFAHYVRQLPDDRQTTLTAALEQQRDQMRPLRQSAREARRRARDAFAAEPFDRQKLAEAYKAASEASMALAAARGEWFTKLATLLTAEERREYLKWQRSHRRPGRRWRSNRRDDD